MVNIKTEFPRGINSDQVISKRTCDGESERASWSGPQATSFKHQANQNLVQVLKQQATSIKPRAASIKLQATSSKLSDPCTTVQEY